MHPTSINAGRKRKGEGDTKAYRVGGEAFMEHIGDKWRGHSHSGQGHPGQELDGKNSLSILNRHTEENTYTYTRHDENT